MESIVFQRTIAIPWWPSFRTIYFYLHTIAIRSFNVWNDGLELQTACRIQFQQKKNNKTITTSIWFSPSNEATHTLLIPPFFFEYYLQESMPFGIPWASDTIIMYEFNSIQCNPLHFSVFFSNHFVWEWMQFLNTRIQLLIYSEKNRKKNERKKEREKWKQETKREMFVSKVFGLD